MGSPSRCSTPVHSRWRLESSLHSSSSVSFVSSVVAFSRAHRLVPYCGVVGPSGGEMSRVHIRRSLAACVGLIVLSGFLPACSAPQPAPAPPAPQTPALWGDMKAVVSVKELMHDMIDPASDYVFNAVSIVDTKGHSVEVGPKTDDDWDKI